MTSAATVSRDHSEALFATPAIVADRRADGSIVLKSLTPLRESARCVGDWLEQWARQAPERIFLGDRAGVEAPWKTVTYGEALRQVRAVAAWIVPTCMTSHADNAEGTCYKTTFGDWQCHFSPVFGVTSSPVELPAPTTY